MRYFKDLLFAIGCLGLAFFIWLHTDVKEINPEPLKADFSIPRPKKTVYMPRGYNGHNGDSIIKSMPARMDCVRTRMKKRMIERMKQ